MDRKTYGGRRYGGQQAPARPAAPTTEYIQGADDKLGQFLDQDIEASAYHRNCLRHSLEGCRSLVSGNINQLSFSYKICGQSVKLLQLC